jgi:hypothetical protein
VLVGVDDALVVVGLVEVVDVTRVVLVELLVVLVAGFELELLLPPPPPLEPGIMVSMVHSQRDIWLLTSRSGHRCGDAAALDVDTRPVIVISSV